MSAERSKNWLLCYDISDPKRLGKVHRYMKKIGISLQYSVFQLTATNQEIEDILGGLEELINEKEDDIRIYPLHKKPKTHIIGNSLFPEGVMLFNN